MFVRCALKPAYFAVRESSLVSSVKQSCSTLVSKHTRPTVRPLSTCLSNKWFSNDEELKTGGWSLSLQPIRNYARAKKKVVFQSQLDELPASTLKMEYAAVPLAQVTDDVVRRLLNLELASHKEKLVLMREQLVAKVRLHEHDKGSPAVKVAVLTARIRNYQEHLQTHHKDKANKRRMLMCVDRRKKILKRLRSTQYDVFENVCKQLGITYTFPPEYYRRVSRRWATKKALCIRVFQEVQKRRKEQRRKMREAAAASKGEAAKPASKDVQGAAA